MRTLRCLIRICLQAFVILTIVSCGSGSDGGSGPEPDHPPSIANLTYSPSTATQVTNGTVTINGTVDFTDTGADVASLRMVTSAGADLTIPTPSFSGLTSGKAAAAFVVSVNAVGKYTFEVWMTDSRGASSNRLSGTFEVLPQVTPEHPPVISNLRYSPSTAIQAPNGTVTIDTKVDFTDAGGDVTALRMLTSAGANLTASNPSLNGSAANAAFDVSVNTVGTYTFEVWAIDSRGSASNRLSGTFEVLPQGTTSGWIRLGVSPPARLFGIAWNGSQYVVVGAQGTVMTSPDLSNWTVQTSGVSHTLRSVASSASRWVAVGEDSAGEAIVLSSPNGATWSVQYRSGACQDNFCAAPAKLSKVIWTGTQFVAVGQERAAGSDMFYALVLTSSDGMTWTQHATRTIALGDDYNLYQRLITSVAWSGSLLAMTGIDVGAGPVVWTSPNADIWTRSELPPAAVALLPLSDITWGNGRFVAVGPPGIGAGAPVFRSVDGINWQSDMSGVNLPPMNAVTTGANEYLAVGDTDRETSVDASVWTASTMTDCGNAVVWDGRRYVSVGLSICRSP